MAHAVSDDVQDVALDKERYPPGGRRLETHGSFDPRKQPRGGRPCARSSYAAIMPTSGSLHRLAKRERLGTVCGVVVPPRAGDMVEAWEERT